MVVFVCFIAVILLLIVIWTVKAGISPMPTLAKVKQSLLNALPATFEGSIVELGSGWGTLARPLAQKYPQSTVTGYEISPVPYFISKLTGRESNLCYVRQDFFQADLSQASLVVCYLYPAAMKRLKAKFEKELKKGSLIVSHTFAIPGWTPEKAIEVDDLYKTKIYFYYVS